MVKSIIVPLLPPERDAENVSELALPLARALAARHNAVMTLMSVIEIGVPMDDTAGSVDEDLIESRDAYLRLTAQAMPGTQTRIVIRNDIDVANQIRQVVAEDVDSIVVMSSHSRQGLRRTVLGSVALEVVNTVPCPVVIVPATGARSTSQTADFHTVLVAADDPAASEVNVNAVLNVIGTGSLDVHLLAAAPSPEEPDDVRLNAELQRDILASRLTTAGYRVTQVLAAGEPDERIVLAAKDIGADIIAMTTRGRTGVRRIVLGSIAESVLRDAGLPVILSQFDAGDE